jgi:hypothetical protein
MRGRHALERDLEREFRIELAKLDELRGADFCD